MEKTQIAEILDSGRVDPYVVLDCEVKKLVKLEGSKETWVAQLQDTNSKEKDSRTLDWLLHQKYLSLMPNSGDTLKRTSSRGLIHTYQRAKSIRSYTGPAFLNAGRKMKICSPRLRQQWNLPGGSLSLLPSEDAIFLLQSLGETSHFLDYNDSILETNDKSANARFSFKAYVLLVPSLNSTQLRDTGYIQPPTPSYGTEAKTVDIILGDQKNRPLAVLRLSSHRVGLVSCIQEGDILCLHGSYLLFESRELVSSRIHFPVGTEKSEVCDAVRLKLPIFSYEAGTLALLLSKNLIDENAALDISTNNESTFETIPQTKDMRFFGPKVSPIFLQPNCNRISMVGYAQRIFSRQTPKNGFRRHGLRLQDSQSSATCDITVWESSESSRSILSGLLPGHLLLIQGIWTVNSREGDAVLANITDDSSKITNLSIMDGFVTSYLDIASACDPQKVISSQSQKWDSMLPVTFYGPFIFHNCQIQSFTMTLPTSLHHNLCERSVGPMPKKSGSSNTDEGIMCKFCNQLIKDWNSDCTWQFNVDWSLEVLAQDQTSKSTIFKVNASSAVTSKLLNISAHEFVQLPPVQQDMIAITLAMNPILGKACVSRSPRCVWQLDQFIQSN